MTQRGRLGQVGCESTLPRPADVIPIRGPMKADNYYKLAVYAGGSETAAPHVASQIFPFTTASPLSHKGAFLALQVATARLPDGSEFQASVWKRCPGALQFPEIGEAP